MDVLISKKKIWLEPLKRQVEHKIKYLQKRPLTCIIINHDIWYLKKFPSLDLLPSLPFLVFFFSAQLYYYIHLRALNGMALLKADMCLAVIEMTSTKLNPFMYLHLCGLYLSLGIYVSLLCDRFIYLLSSLFLKVNKLVYLGQEKLGGNFTRIVYLMLLLAIYIAGCTSITKIFLLSFFLSFIHSSFPFLFFSSCFCFCSFFK